jgi:hypothetical protein
MLSVDKDVVVVLMAAGNGMKSLGSAAMISSPSFSNRW